MTLGELIIVFLEHLAGNGRKPDTLSTYRRRFNRMHQWPGLDASTQLDDITPETLDRWAGTIRNSELATATQLGYIQAVKTLFVFAARRGYTAVNLGQELERPHLDHSVLSGNKCMSRDDLHRLIDATTERGNVRDLAILMFIADTGARRGEVVKLRMADLLLDNCDAWVDGKSGRALVDYTPATAGVLRIWLEQRPDVDHDFVFVGGTSPTCPKPGQPLQPGAINSLLRRIAKRAGVNGRCNPHSIRHLVGQTFTDNVNLELVRQKLRHTNINTTAMFYSHQDRSRVKAATILYSPLGTNNNERKRLLDETTKREGIRS